jgi:hypothetical protein
MPNEQLPGQEFNEQEQTLIASLREHGPENPDTAELLSAWTAEQESRAAEINTPRANTELDMKKGKLYRAAGFADAARFSFDWAREQANQQPDCEDIFEEANRLLDELDAAGL